MLHSVTSDAVDLFAVEFTSRECMLGGRSYPLGFFAAEALDRIPDMVELQSSVASMKEALEVFLTARDASSAGIAHEAIGVLWRKLMTLPVYERLIRDEHRAQAVIPDWQNSPEAMDEILAPGTDRHTAFRQWLSRLETLERELKLFAQNIGWMLEDYFEELPSRKREAYAEAFAGSKIPLLLLTREKEQEQDSIFLNKRNEAHQVVHAASGAGHRKILFVHRDSKERLHVHKNPGFTYYHVREELLSPASDSVCDICTFHDFTEMLSKKTPFQYTMLYFSFTFARNVMEALDQHGVRVPEDVSCLVYGKSDPRFFHGLEPDSIDFRQPMEDLIGNWFEQRIFSKETSGTFREELFPALLPGQTIRNIN